jgi:AcrR family transcriptional regulator
MTITERRERERTETRDLILDAARELFISEGYEGVSMRKVAEKIEYSPTAIYVHFPNKQDLFLELCHSDFRKLAETFTRLEQLPDPVERLRRLGMAYVEFGLQNPQHYRMMFMTSHPPLPEKDETKMGKGNPEEDAYAFLRHCVQKAIDAGAFWADLSDADLIAQTLWAATHGVLALHIAKCSDPWVPWRDVHQRAELIIDGLLYGLLRKKE